MKQAWYCPGNNRGLVSSSGGRVGSLPCSARRSEMSRRARSQNWVFVRTEKTGGKKERS